LSASVYNPNDFESIPKMQIQQIKTLVEQLERIMGQIDVQESSGSTGKDVPSLGIMIFPGELRSRYEKDTCTREDAIDICKIVLSYEEGIPVFQYLMDKFHFSMEESWIRKRFLDSVNYVDTGMVTFMMNTFDVKKDIFNGEVRKYLQNINFLKIDTAVSMVKMIVEKMDIQLRDFHFDYETFVDFFIDVETLKFFHEKFGFSTIELEVLYKHGKHNDYAMISYLTGKLSQK